MKNIKDKVIVITGASSGIGEEAAKLLAKAGATVVLCARRKERLEQIAGEIKQAGGKADFYAVDVTQKDQLTRMIDEAATKHGRIDVLIGNAGLMATSPIGERKVDEWDRMIDINLKGILYGVAAVLPVFERQNTGHFINVASIAGLKVAASNVVYCATKFAVRALSEGLRQEYVGKFRVTTISPGYVESELMNGTSDPLARDGVVQAYAKYAIPSSSVAEAILYAIAQPQNTSISEIVIRPTVQEF